MTKQNKAKYNGHGHIWWTFCLSRNESLVVLRLQQGQGMLEVTVRGATFRYIHSTVTQKSKKGFSVKLLEKITEISSRVLFYNAHRLKIITVGTASFPVEFWFCKGQ